MKIRIVVVGRLQQAPCRTLAEDYFGRLMGMAQVELVEVKDGKASDATRRLAEEAKLLREAARLKEGKPRPGTFRMDMGGTELSSESLAALIEKCAMSGGEMTLLIGSTAGFSPELAKEIPKSLSLSRCTFPHEIARVLLFEQLYRAFCILKGHPYHQSSQSSLK